MSEHVSSRRSLAEPHRGPGVFAVATTTKTTTTKKTLA